MSETLLLNTGYIVTCQWS